LVFVVTNKKIEEITLITDILNKNGSLIIIDAIMHTYDVNTNAIFIMIIWFKTSIPNKLFRLLFHKTNWWRDYEEYRKKSTVASNVREYLWQRYSHWFFELINCHYCLAFWLVLATHVACGSPLYFLPFTYAVVLVIYKLT